MNDCKRFNDIHPDTQDFIRQADRLSHASPQRYKTR